MRGNNTNQTKNRHPSVHYNSNCNSDVNSSKENQSPIVNSSIVAQPQIVNSSVSNQALDETEIVHLGKSSKDDCSLFIQTGKKIHKVLWDSGACKCVLSLESYQMIPDKYKTDLFSSNIKIKAANGTIIKNNGECDITFRMGTEKFTFPFLCSDQLSQAIIIGHNFCNTLNIGTVWSAPDIMSLTYEGKTIAQCVRSKGINALVFCAESTVIPPFSNGKIPCRAPKVKSFSNIAPSVIFEPSYRHRANYINCHTYDGLVTVDEHATSSGSFHIVMTNNSNQHVKVTKNQTLGMLKSCDSDQICTIHRLVTFEPKSLEGEGMKLEYTKNSQTINSIKTQPTTNNSHDVQSVTKDFYQIPTRNKKGEIEILTLLKDEVSKINKITDTALEEEFVSHQKPKLQDAPIDQRTKLELEQLLIRNSDCFAEDECQLGTTPLITMSIDTGDHPPVAKRPYTLAP